MVKKRTKNYKASQKYVIYGGFARCMKVNQVERTWPNAWHGGGKMQGDIVYTEKMHVQRQRIRKVHRGLQNNSAAC